MSMNMKMYMLWVLPYFVECCFPSGNLNLQSDPLDKLIKADESLFLTIPPSTTTPLATQYREPLIMPNPDSEFNMLFPMQETNPLNKLLQIPDTQQLYKRVNLSATTTTTTARTTTTTITTTSLIMPLLRAPSPFFKIPTAVQAPLNSPAALRMPMPSNLGAQSSFLRLSSAVQPLQRSPSVAQAPPPSINLPTLFPMVLENSLPKTFVKTEKIPKLVGSPTWKITHSPPVSWTYCSPNCGSGDQAVDEESALDNALNDAILAVNSAFQSLKLAPLNDNQVHIKYKPSNILLEEFGEFYDRYNSRYRSVRNSIRYRIRKENPGVVEEYVEEIEIGFEANYMFTKSLWKTFAAEMVNYLTKERYMYARSEPEMISSMANNSSFLLFF